MKAKDRQNHRAQWANTTESLRSLSLPIHEHPESRIVFIARLQMDVSSGCSPFEWIWSCVFWDSSAPFSYIIFMLLLQQTADTPTHGGPNNRYSMNSKDSSDDVITLSVEKGMRACLLRDLSCTTYIPPPQSPSPPLRSSTQTRLGSNLSQACPRSSYPAAGPTCISFQHRAQ